MSVSHQTCKGCGAVIYWIKGRALNSVPMNMDGSSHWGTCPMAHKFRSPDQLALFDLTKFTQPAATQTDWRIDIE